MKKSVLTSLIAASALFTGVAFAGGFAADAGYTSADTSAMAGSENGFLNGMYVGVGVNHSTENTAKTTVNDLTVTDLDTSDYGFGVLVGKNLTDMFAVELAYNSFGKNSFKNSDGDVYADFYQTWDTSISGVINSPSFDGFSAHAKGGVAYLSEKAKFIDGDTTQVSSSAQGTFVYGLGLQYALDKIALSLDWTRFQGNNNTSYEAGNMYLPDQYSLNLIYTFA